jgi:hypothetical protein
MKIRLLVLLWLVNAPVILCVGRGTSNGAEADAEFSATPPFQGDSLPESPAQRKDWAPPVGTKLSALFLTATKDLFKLGLPDPRDCEYREIAFGMGSVQTGDAGIQQFHGWLLPEQGQQRAESSGTAARFAIAWDGLIYPVVRAGARADLKSDVEAACRADESNRAKWAGQYPRTVFGVTLDQTDEADAASENVSCR